MSRYRIEFKPRARKQLKKLPTKEIKRISEAISALAEEPRPDGCVKLKGRKEDLYRIRVGNYRILYSIEDEILLIVIVVVKDRREAYR